MIDWLQWRYVFWVLVLYTAIQRIVELRHSSRNQKLMRSELLSGVDSPISYYLMVSVHASWFLAMILENIFSSWPMTWSLHLFGGGVFVLAQGLKIWAIASLGRQWNTRVMTPTVGHADEKEWAVVRTGPYRFIRHPNYLAVILEFLSLPLIGGSIVTLMIWSILNGIVLRSRIRLEDYHLFKRSGYLEEFGNKPALIPFSRIGCR